MSKIFNFILASIYLGSSFSVMAENIKVVIASKNEHKVLAVSKAFQERFPDDEIEEIKIYDNGRGYNARLLGLFYSTKDSSQGDSPSGKFGEGIKMMCAASLRRGIDVTLRSQDWSAKAKVAQQEIDGREINQLVYDVTHAVKGKEIDDGDDQAHASGSSTTFSHFTPALVQEFRQVMTEQPPSGLIEYVVKKIQYRAFLVKEE